MTDMVRHKTKSIVEITKLVQNKKYFIYVYPACFMFHGYYRSQIPDLVQQFYSLVHPEEGIIPCTNHIIIISVTVMDSYDFDMDLNSGSSEPYREITHADPFLDPSYI